MIESDSDDRHGFSVAVKASWRLDDRASVVGTVSGRPAYATEGGSTIVVPDFDGRGFLVVRATTVVVGGPEPFTVAELVRIAQGVRWTG